MSDTEATSTQEEVNTADAEVNVEPINLTLADLNALGMIVQAACTRGAFKAEEYSQVGAVYDRLNAFLKQAQPPAEETEATEGDTQAEATAEPAGEA